MDFSFDGGFTDAVTDRATTGIGCAISGSGDGSATLLMNARHG
jgi:hypothetical protein